MKKEGGNASQATKQKGQIRERTYVWKTVPPEMMVSSANTAKSRTKTSSALSSYTDPLITLLHSSDLNKDKQLSETLYEYIDDITDMELKKWCIDSLTVLRNLEKIETQLDQWEFHTLDFTLEVDSHIQKPVDSGKNDSIRKKLASRVLDKSVLLRDLLSQQKEEIDTSISRARQLSTTSPAKVITDAGTILIELTMRIVKLGKHLDEQVMVGYSRAKLTIIGTELKKLVTLDPYVIDKDVVQNYTTFVNNLLSQLNMAVAHNDTVVLWESVAIIGDVEKMFESMKQNTSMPSSKEKHSDTSKEKTHDVDNDLGGAKSPSLHETEDADIDSPPIVETNGFNNDSGVNTDTTLVNSEPSIDEEMKKEESRTVAHISAKEIFHDDNDLIRTKITDHIPELIQAFNKKEVVSAKTMEQTVEDKQNLEAGKAKVTNTYATKQREAGSDRQEQHKAEEQEEKTGLEKEREKEKENKPEQEQEQGGSYFSYFKPSILSAFYQPQLKEPIYVNKESFSGSPEKESENETKSGNGKLLTNATVAVRLDQMSFEDRSKQELLERERSMRKQEAIIDSQLGVTHPALSSSAVLNQLSSSVLAKSIKSNHHTSKEK